MQNFSQSRYRLPRNTMKTHLGLKQLSNICRLVVHIVAFNSDSCLFLWKQRKRQTTGTRLFSSIFLVLRLDSEERPREHLLYRLAHKLPKKTGGGLFELLGSILIRLSTLISNRLPSSTNKATVPSNKAEGKRGERCSRFWRAGVMFRWCSFWKPLPYNAQISQLKKFFIFW